MGALMARLRRRPGAAVRLLLASLAINLLGLASSLYVMQVLSRYVSYGVGATLLTLTAGVMLALAGEYLLRLWRLALAEALLGDDARQLAVGVFGLTLTARADALPPREAGRPLEIARGLERAEGALGPANLAALADLPFSLLFLAVLLPLSPLLAGAAALFWIVATVDAWHLRRALAPPTAELTQAARATGVLAAAAVHAVDTVRQFNGSGLLMTRWQAAETRARNLRTEIGRKQQEGTARNQGLQALMGVAIIGCGATQVVAGTLDVGVLIGANLIAGRALAPVLRLVHLAQALVEAEQGLAAARHFATIPVEPEGGRVPEGWRGGLALADFALGIPGAAPGTPPLVAGLTLELEPGGVLVVTGRNGSGKTCLLRALAGLGTPAAGAVLVAGVDLRQVSLGWWRRQVSYLPQEPQFLEGTVGENLVAARPGASEADVLRALERAGLRPWLDRLPGGLSHALVQGGQTLPPGLRRRLALARALVVDGPLLLLDEPSEGLDRDGTDTVYALLMDLARQGRTLVVASHDPAIARGAGLLLTLDGAGTRVMRPGIGGGGP